jgi:uncharacterized membrane protein YdbT with pleckstrin-like domain
LSRGSPSSEPDVIWEGRPWVAPRVAATAAEAVLLAVALSYVEVVWLGVDLSVLGATLLVVALVWLVGAAELEALAWSNHYSLRWSSLEVEHGILTKSVLAVSAAGFSDLEVTRSLSGRLLNLGNIVIQTDSDRDVALLRVRDPVKVSTLIRQVMTVPLVRVDGQGPLLAPGGAIPR